MKIIFLLNGDILTIHTKFCAIMMVSVVKPNIQPDIWPDIRIRFLLPQVLSYDIVHACINFHANPLNFKNVNKPDIRPDIQIQFLLSQVPRNNIMHTSRKFHANLFNIKEVKKPDIRPDIRIITKIHSNFTNRVH